MAFDSVTDFFAMGGYGFFVWLSYGVSAASVILYVLYVKHQKKSIQAQVLAQAAREARIKAAKAASSSVQTNS
jgi:heme exporter protein D